MPMETQTERHKRIDWIDLAKFIGIILVIIGHSKFTGHISHLCRSAIFSFHMPLFFILSAATFRLSADSDQFITKTERAFKHLIIPALLLYGLNIIIEICHLHNIKWASFLANKINILTYASGVPIRLLKQKILSAGIIWFLFALFSGRTLFDYLHLKVKGTKHFTAAIIFCSLLGALIGSKIQRLPLSLDIALACLPFFCCGYYLQKKSLDNINNKLLSVCSLLTWIGGLTLSYFCIGSDKKFYLDLAYRQYPLFPFCYIIAIAGTLFVSSCSIFLADRLKNWINPLLYIGRNSLVLYGVHYMDRHIKFLWKSTHNNICNCLLRVAIDIAIFFAVMKIIEFIQNRKKQQTQAPEPQRADEAEQARQTKSDTAQ